jgi:polysaccharide biosynthesis protein VpsQ
MNKLTIAVTACFFVFILWIIYLADSGESSIFFDLVKSIPYGDKFCHFLLFGTLTLLLILATRFKSFFIGHLTVYYGVVLVALFAVLEEISQAYIPSRTFDLVDLSADSIGIILSAGLAVMTKRLRSLHQGML